MVIKSVEGIVSGKKGLLQPAIKCRGREYLRITCGPSYTEQATLARLRQHQGNIRATASRRVWTHHGNNKATPPQLQD